MKNFMIKTLRMTFCIDFDMSKIFIMNNVAVFSQFIILIYLVGNTIMKKDLLLFEEREKNGKQ